MYFFQPISNEVRLFQKEFHHYKNTKKLILGSIFACFAAIFQASGGFLPDIGYVISPLATAPILLCTIFSIPSGVMIYFLTMMLLFIIQPTELIIFPFTTGLLGLGLGTAFSLFRRRISIIFTGSVLLMIGILSLLFIFHFPVLGPVVSSTFSFLKAGGIFVFTFLYSWLWVEIALFIVKRLNRLIS
ncbi:hypothetical protein [Oceanobacillus senegalensis]|uniref:hypothetical protein n=1 Tax=Oceanobacillus senegalensis TaxID=1936063 RepID=UPI000A305CE6|nr:hypothetical protein [Oceanobacillus senegalensis]